MNNHPPGWNDPPPISHVGNEDGKESSKSRPKFNQRVAFPIASTPTSGNKTLDASAPPPMTGAPPRGPTSLRLNPATMATAKTTETTTTKDVESVYSSLASLLQSSSSLSASKRADIERRLQTMRSKWERDELGPKLKQGLGDLVELLEHEQYEKADKLHVALTLDWPSECSAWMVGVKHLIALHKSQVSEEESKEGVLLQPLSNRGTD